MNAATSHPGTARPWMPWTVGVVVVVLLALLPVTWNNLYYQNMIILGAVLAIAGLSWNVLGGFAGYVSLGHSAFLGVGAYATAITAVSLGWPLWASLVAAVLVTAVSAAVMGAIALRTRGVAFIMITFAMLELLRVVAMNVPELTKGNHGLSLPILPGLTRQTQQWPYYYGLLALLVLSVIGTIAIRRSKLGAGLLSIREDEDKAASIGVVTPQYKMVAIVLSSLPVGIAGGLYAYYLGYIEPAGMFSIFVAMQIVLVAILGGRGTILGPVVGAAIIEPLTQFTNQQIGGPAAGAWRLILLGGLIAFVIIVLPKGIIPTVAAWIARRRTRDEDALTGTRVVADQAPGAVVRERTPRHPDAAQPPLLEVRGLTKHYGGLVALDDCTFDVPRGSVTALIGPNGSGKTTAFNVIDGSVAAEGTVILDGEDITRMPRWSRAHAGIARTFQTTRLFPELSVRDNLVAPLRRFGPATLVRPAYSGEELERARAALETVGLGRYLDVRAGSLSYGQQKLVELAQCIVLDPDLILLDEPGAGINPALVDRIGELVLDLRDAGKTFLIVEHNMPFVLGLCEPIHVLARGRRIATGTAEEIRSNPEVLEAYLGSRVETAGGTAAREVR
jgi:branched-chain amino acid transport system permease protein